MEDYNHVVFKGFFMEKWKLIIVNLISLFLLCGCSIFSKEEVSQELPNVNKEETPIIPVVEKKVVTTPVEPSIQQVKIRKFADIYPENSEVLLSTIAVLSNLDDKTCHQVKKIIEDRDVYYITQQDNNVFMVAAIDSESEEFQRHGIELVRISNDGTMEDQQLVNIEDDDSDVWEFDKKTKLPVRHIHYNIDGHIEYGEYWNYSNENPVKYELKDNDNKTIAIKKEVPDGDSNIRIENLIYDEEGNTKINITMNYEGPYITRFTYFNAETPEDGVVIVREFEDGVEVKETVYSTDYKVKNVYEAFYKNDIRDSIKVFDNEHRELEEILSN